MRGSSYMYDMVPLPPARHGAPCARFRCRTMKRLVLV